MGQARDITPRDITLDLGTHTLQRGCTLTSDTVTARLYGDDSHPLVVVMGGISANRYVADGDANGPKPNTGWWSPLVRPAGPLDTTKLQILGVDFAPNATQSCPETITTHDQANRLAALLAHIGRPASGLVGSSYGGMVGLALAQHHPDSVQRLCIVSAAHKPFSIGVAWRGIQRRVVRLALDAGRPEDGLKLARELAMTTYRTPEEFADRFTLQETATSPAAFDICDYLESRGNAFATAMDAERFLALSESVDLHRVHPESIPHPTLLLTAISDQLAPLQDMRELRDRLAGPARLHTFTSLYGHDAFLKEWDAMSAPLAEWSNGIISAHSGEGRNLEGG